MAFVTVVFSLLCMLFAKKGKSVIKPGSGLSAEFGNNSSWVSPSGHFAFGFYPQGNGFAVGIWLLGGSPPQKTIVWTANRDSHPLPSNSTLNITTTGLRLFLSGRESLVLIPTVNTTSASMLDSGNFVLYSNGSTVVWQSFDYPTDTLLGGQNLTSGAELVSSVSEKDYSSGAFYMLMHQDGNLVAYPKNSGGYFVDAYWASNTFDDSELLGLDATGSLCIGILCLNENFSPRNKSHNTSSIYRATLAADGNLILYEHQFEDSVGSTNVRVLWSTSIEKCQIKGFCGFNSYCSNVTGDAVCECFPGFVPSNNSGNVSQDCILAYALDGCRSREAPNQMILYNITQLEHVSWFDTPYSVVPMKEKECEKSLLDDCDCVAVLYSNGNCEKYGLPLTYGRWLQNLSVVALFKNASGTVQNLIPSNFFPKPKSKVVTDNKNSLIMILAFTLGSISFLSLIFSVSIFFTYKRKVHKYTTLSASENLGFTGECSLRSFSFDELVKSTGNFTEEIGRGSFGAVYRGETGDDSQSIAVKRLERVAAGDWEREFRNEITSIARTHHRNLVKLIGFCIDGARSLLVYEYVRNGSLGSLLFNDEKQISWRDRLKIALDVARGILYLHDECEVRIIHCNINPRNILMDEAWTAKISDFGFARLLKSEHSRMRKEDDGTSKYLAPEWQKEAPVSVKFDIYSFGMVLLEIVCRRRSIEMNVSSAEEIVLSSWVYKCFAEGQLNRLVKEDEGVEWKIMERMVKVGLWCVQDTPSLRPLIKNVILMLEGLKDIPIPPSPAHPLH
ncbi:G-type lectin S-receptor-like serine/threonine-protein kinase LECRK3 [Vigna radiata var. radiata]|uniref:Receptor-like serine/threonine-protein kinase n=1 Tax=Vigna radiata var. radiata TaxID=3916 RepID=A0A1S3UKY2_VIGRR|nr:G-type lectin S-receptor-like serine/threonine-protein kinase LECRK3 [Vigna radiata var. radiata]